MSTLVRVIDDLGSLLSASGEYDIILGHAPDLDLEDIAITVLMPATPGVYPVLGWLLFSPSAPPQRYLGSGTVTIAYDQPRQLLLGSAPFTVGYMKLLILRLALLQGVAAGLERVAVTAKFTGGRPGLVPAETQGSGD